MNRKDLQNLTDIRLKDAQALFLAKQFSGAYYLAGYALECAFKACIAKQYKRYEFPDRKIVNDSWTHDLRKLASIAKLDEIRDERAKQDDIFRKNWDVSILWSEESRYRTADRSSCKTLIDAIMEEHHGLIPWIKALW